MFGKKKKSLDLKINDYVMSEEYKSETLVIANLEFISSEVTLYGPMIKTTDQKYLFEKVIDNDKVKYREIFTGFIADPESHVFDIPYPANILPLTEQYYAIEEYIHKYGLLLLIDEINNLIKDGYKEGSDELKDLEKVDENSYLSVDEIDVIEQFVLKK